MLRSLAPAAPRGRIFIDSRVHCRRQTLMPIYALSFSSFVANQVQVDNSIALFTSLSDTLRYIGRKLKWVPSLCFSVFIYGQGRAKADNGLLARHLRAAIVYIESRSGVICFLLRTWLVGLRYSIIAVTKSPENTRQVRFSVSLW